MSIPLTHLLSLDFLVNDPHANLSDLAFQTIHGLTGPDTAVTLTMALPIGYANKTWPLPYALIIGHIYGEIEALPVFQLWYRTGSFLDLQLRVLNGSPKYIPC
ncbi:hypothetical protein RRF57_009143 [Xylaria bambusicola]|uniref:Uncharacterized protein n=1 Tax=Xylaria bambusicola TaxID=326684 RepID=A0AAN7UT68_9PEZI